MLGRRSSAMLLRQRSRQVAALGRLGHSASWLSSPFPTLPSSLPSSPTPTALRGYTTSTTTTAATAAVTTHTVYGKESLLDALQECSSRFAPDGPAPTLTTVVVSSKHYYQQVHGTDALHATLHKVLPPWLSSSTSTVLALLDNANAADWSFYEQFPPFVTITTLALPAASSPTCTFFSFDDSIPSLRTPAGELLPLRALLGAKGAPLHLMVFTPQSPQSGGGDKASGVAEMCLKMQSRVRHMFPNGEAFWVACTHNPLMYTDGRPVSAPIVGLAITYPDATALLSEWILRSFPHSSATFNTMSASLFVSVFAPKANVTLPPPTATPTEDDLQGIWRGIYMGYGPEVLTFSVVHSEGEGKCVFATKLTGDPYVPRGKVSWKTGTKVMGAFGEAVQAQIQVASRNYTSPRFVRCTAAMPNPHILHVSVAGEQAWSVVYTKLQPFDDKAVPVHGRSFSLFYARECGLLPGAYCTYNIFEARYRRMVQRALETDGLIAILDTRATLECGAYHAVGTLARVVYHVSEDAPHRTRITAVGIRRFRVRCGVEPVVQDSGLAVPVLDAYDDVAVAATAAGTSSSSSSLEAGWALVDEIAPRLAYNPLSYHLYDYVSAHRSSSECLSMVSFSLANQLHDEMFLCNPPSITLASVSKDEARVGAEQLRFQQRVMQAQCPIERLRILKEYVLPPPPKPMDTVAVGSSEGGSEQPPEAGK